MAAYIIQGACVDCGTCVESCPTEGVYYSESFDQYNISADRCIECGSCVDECPTGAIQLAGYESRDSLISGSDIMNSAENWQGTPYREMDCSNFVHRVYNDLGLDYPYRNTEKFKYLSQFQQISPEDVRTGDVMVIRGSNEGHMGIYNSNPPEAGRYIYGSTVSGGVRYGFPSWFKPKGNDGWKYYRYKQGGE